MSIASRSIVIALLLGLLTSAVRGADANPAELKKLYALLVIDTLSGLGESVSVDGERMEFLLQGGVPKDRLELTILTGKDVTANRILNYFKELRVGPSDVLLFYYAGHGATDPEKGHFLALQQLDTKPLIRSDLRRAMTQHNPGLTVILTDCCSTRYKLGKQRRKIEEVAGVAKQVDPALRYLLFQHRGVVDITATTSNAAFGDDHDGGLFTRSLAASIKQTSKDVAKAPGHTVSWKELFPHVQQATATAFARWSKDQRARGENVEQTTQTPRAFDLADPSFLPSLTLRNGTNATVRYQYRWGSEGNWEDGTLPPAGSRIHSAPPNNAGPDRPVMEVKFEDGESGTLKLGKTYRYTPDAKK